MGRNLARTSRGPAGRSRCTASGARDRCRSCAARCSAGSFRGGSPARPESRVRTRCTPLPSRRRAGHGRRPRCRSRISAERPATVGRSPRSAGPAAESCPAETDHRYPRAPHVQDRDAARTTEPPACQRPSGSSRGRPHLLRPVVTASCGALSVEPPRRPCVVGSRPRCAVQLWPRRRGEGVDP
jgi:hypothetical protein